MRKVKIINSETLQDADTGRDIICPMSHSSAQTRYCRVDCAWYRAIETDGKVDVYCGTKPIGELNE